MAGRPIDTALANAVVARHLSSGDHKRANEAAHTAILLALISGLFLAIMGQIFPMLILRLISTPAEILPLASLYLRIYFAGMPFIMLYNFTGALRGMGHSLAPAIVCILGICVFRLFWIFLIYPHNPVYPFLILVYPVSWIITVTSMILIFLRVMRKVG